ncbi:MAG: ImmA/IrrE family metallo-endopeptidase [Clostridia bacterium]|nr:ImmA/IrrE family metallo-endopeptidase [Clostridia bacterium]
MEINRLYSLANQSGVTVDRMPLPENGSISIKFKDKMFIGIDKNASSSHEKVYLAHELGHCQTSSFYNIYSPFDIRGKHERRATIWAISKLIPKTVYQKAIRLGYDNIYSLAEYFGVTPDFMQKAVDYYRSA